jgi:transcriptional regulator with XRE-family HTH domain
MGTISCVPQKLLIQLGQRIREFRKRKGLSQEELAEATGLHRTYIGGIERGERNVSIINLSQIAKALDISLSVLFEEV